MEIVVGMEEYLFKLVFVLFFYGGIYLGVNMVGGFVAMF